MSKIKKSKSKLDDRIMRMRESSLRFRQGIEMLSELLGASSNEAMWTSRFPFNCWLWITVPRYRKAVKHMRSLSRNFREGTKDNHILLGDLVSWIKKERVVPEDLSRRVLATCAVLRSIRHEVLAISDEASAIFPKKSAAIRRHYEELLEVSDRIQRVLMPPNEHATIEAQKQYDKGELMDLETFVNGLRGV